MIFFTFNFLVSFEHYCSFLLFNVINVVKATADLNYDRIIVVNNITFMY